MASSLASGTWGGNSTCFHLWRKEIKKGELSTPRTTAPKTTEYALAMEKYQLELERFAAIPADMTCASPPGQTGLSTETDGRRLRAPLKTCLRATRKETPGRPSPRSSPPGCQLPAVLGGSPRSRSANEEKRLFTLLLGACQLAGTFPGCADNAN